MSRTLQLRLAYNGERFSGWQIQPDQRTVQGVLSDAIKNVSGETIIPKGSSRTDAGVHAADQVASFTTSSTCLLYTSPSPRDVEESRMPSSA